MKSGGCDDGCAAFHVILDRCPLLLKIHLPTDVSVRSKRASLTTTTTTTTNKPAQHPSSQKHENQTPTHFYWDTDSAVYLAQAFKTLTMRTLKNKLELELIATTQNLGECTSDDMNKIADGIAHTLTKAAKMSLKHKGSRKKTEKSKANKRWSGKDRYPDRN